MLAFALIVTVELILHRKKATTVGQSESQKWLWGFSLAILLFSGYITVNQSMVIDTIQNQSSNFIIDTPSQFFKIIIIIAGIIVLFHVKILKYSLANEFYPLFIFQILGLFLLVISSHFLLIYLSIEIVSIASYIYTTFGRNKKASEASIKYALFGGISSAIMLYGISLIYGITGTMDLLSPDFSRNLNQIEPIALSFVLLLTFAGFLFKISAFPFHLWVADVYEAMPTPIVSFISIAPKVAGILVFTRIVTVIPISQQNILLLISIFSIAIGNFSALRQKNIKRMLGYSTIAQAGFVVGAIACLSNLGIQSAYFYLFGYLFTNMLAFILIDVFNEKSKTEGYLIENYKGIGTQLPFWGIMILISMVSLVGLPPTVGFSGKLFLFSAIWESYQLTQNKLVLFLFIFGLFNTAISLYYYLKLPFFAFFRKSTEAEENIFSTTQIVFSIILGIPVLFYFFKADLLMNWIGEIVK
ncbi:MAG: NADH-quinone oxidoreductase subunit N [Bacteroidota bacterium]